MLRWVTCFVVLPPEEGVQITGSRPASRFRVVVEGKFDISTNGCRIANVRHPDATVEMSVLTSVFVGGARLIGVGFATICFYKCSLMLQTHVLQASSRSAICVRCDAVVC